MTEALGAFHIIGAAIVREVGGLILLLLVAYAFYSVYGLLLSLLLKWFEGGGRRRGSQGGGVQDDINRGHGSDFGGDYQAAAA